MRPEFESLAYDMPWLPPVAFLLLFVGMWLAVTYLLSYISGWVTFAKYYRATRPFNGANVRVRGAQMGRSLMGNFRNVLTVGVNTEGISLHLLFLFAINSPDLFVPWPDITVSRGRRWFMEYIEFRFKRAPDIPLRVFGRPGGEIQGAAGAKWPKEAPRDVVRR
jgi:hypothetical protein